MNIPLHQIVTLLASHTRYITIWHHAYDGSCLLPVVMTAIINNWVQGGTITVCLTSCTKTTGLGLSTLDVVLGSIER